MTDARRQITKSIGYPESVHQQAFAIWYKMGKPPYGQVVDAMKTELNMERAPSIYVIRYWHANESWEEHADELDANIAAATDKEIIKQRQNIIKKLADVGGEMVEMGMQYLRKEGIENSADAIRAIGKGAELENQLLGWAAYYAEIAKKSDEDLTRELYKYMTPDIPTQVIEVTGKDEESDRPETEE